MSSGRRKAVSMAEEFQWVIPWSLLHGRADRLIGFIRRPLSMNRDQLSRERKVCMKF